MQSAKLTPEKQTLIRDQQPSASRRGKPRVRGCTGGLCLTVKDGVSTGLPQTVPETEGDATEAGHKGKVIALNT